MRHGPEYQEAGIAAGGGAALAGRCRGQQFRRRDRASVRQTDLHRDRGLWSWRVRGDREENSAARTPRRAADVASVRDDGGFGRGSGGAVVAVMQTGHQRDRDDVPQRRWVDVAGKGAIVA